MDQGGDQTAGDLSDLRQGLRTYFFAARLTRRSVLPLLLVLVNAGVYAAFVYGAPRNPQGDVHAVALLLAGAKVSALVLSGEWWRILSSVFVHADLTHLLVNCLGMYFLAQVADNVFGWVRTLVLYVLGGAAGALLSTGWSLDASVGASGANYGMLGAVAAFGIVQRRRIPPPLQKVLLTGTVIWVVISVAYTAGAESIDNAAHVGGAAMGALLALLFGGDLPVFRPAPQPTPRVWKVAAVLCCLAVAASSIFAARSIVSTSQMPVPVLSLVPVDKVRIPYPSQWTRGRLSGTCKPDDKASVEAILSNGAACFQDPYGSTYLIGRAADLAASVMMDPSMTLEYGLKSPMETHEGDVTRRFLMLNRRWAVSFLSYRILADRYDRLVAALIDGVVFEGRQEEGTDQVRPTP